MADSMDKREKHFPYEIYRHRVQELKKSRGMTNSELYDVMDIGGTDSYSSRNRAVNSALKNPNYRHIEKLHEHFNVSADYLLGFDEGHAGLSEEAENYLQSLKSNHPLELKALDLMLRNGSGLLELLSRIVDIERFCHRKAELETTLTFFNREATRLIDAKSGPEDPEQQEEFREECRRVEKTIRETEDQLKAIGGDTAYVAAAYDAVRSLASYVFKVIQIPVGKNSAEAPFILAALEKDGNVAVHLIKRLYFFVAESESLAQTEPVFRVFAYHRSISQIITVAAAEAFSDSALPFIGIVIFF